MTGSAYPGVWRPGDPRGDRRFAPLFGDGRELKLEAGGVLAEVTVAYETWGQLSPAGDNAVLVLHALTGDSHARGPAGPGHPSSGWWEGLVGPGAAIDTGRFFVVCPNVLGGCQGTTGPGSAAPDGRPFGSRFPRLTIRDQVAAEAALAEQLGIGCWAAVIGGSMGGMRALEWSVSHPESVRRAIVIAVGAAASVDQISLSSLQVRAIRADPAWRGGDYYEHGERPVAGLGVARGIGHYSYRTAVELETRFGRRPQEFEEPLEGGRYAVESYLEHHGEKLARRFDPGSYVVLSEAMNYHDLGRGRGGIAEALAAVRAETTVVGIASDRLYPLELQHEIASLLHRPTEVHVVSSASGHDGFLIETAQIAPIVREALAG